MTPGGTSHSGTPVQQSRKKRQSRVVASAPTDPAERWDAEARRPDVYEYVQFFGKPYTPSRDLWEQILERFCKWLHMSGVILESKDHARGTSPIFSFSYRDSPGEHDAEAKVAGKRISGAKSPDFARLPWQLIEYYFRDKPYEVLEHAVDEGLKSLGVRNYFILALSSADRAPRFLLLYNAAPRRYFDQGTYGLCRTTLLYHAAIAKCLAWGEKETDAIFTEHPHVRAHRLWAALDFWKLFAEEHPPRLIGQFFDLVLDEWPQEGLKDLITQTLGEFVGENWKSEKDVFEKTSGWEESTRASIARAYTVIGMPEIAEALYRSASKET